MARPNQIKIRLSDEEHDNLKNRSGDQPLAVWMREYCLGADIQNPKKPKRPPPKVDPELIRHIAILGNNLNQIARRVNSAGVSNSVELLVEMGNIERALSILLVEFSNDS